MNNMQKFDSIDDLFAAARLDEPTLRDDNFTKLVINQLPAAPRRIDTRGISFDMIAALIGGVLAFMLVDFNAIVRRIWGQGIDASDQLLNTWNVASSSSAVLASTSSPLIMAGVAISVVVISSVAAWALVEKPNWIR